jgi:hypothetical protein
MQLHHHLPYKCITIFNAIIASPSTIQVHHHLQCNYCITIYHTSARTRCHHLQCNCITIYNTFAITIYNTFASPSSLHLHHHHDIFLAPVPMNLSLSLSLSKSLSALEISDGAACLGQSKPNNLPVHQQGWMVNSQETVFCWIVVP